MQGRSVTEIWHRWSRATPIARRHGTVLYFDGHYDPDEYLTLLGPANYDWHFKRLDPQVAKNGAHRALSTKDAIFFEHAHKDIEFLLLELKQLQAKCEQLEKAK